ncbi:uncharacterized protein EI97DRAFT_458685 [Westerdykella ornata]|uniref:Uncharacterized protein n=1 Tax=Westerdykella ornata TaxID=318751 RepID=A0A6A6JIF2_WESOR|nr:uncharacterized protein EI97DRAFT_458685 [Westerdykella ornata]KAF2276197.1 hypothetical protein EI97DRAFT_458685 [Westerdykella ornata]
MPTPDDAMLSPPPEHESTIAGLATCPEESRLHALPDLMSPQFTASIDNGDSSPTRPTQVPTPPPGDQERQPSVTSPADPSPHTKKVKSELSRLMRFPTPASVQEEPGENQRNQQAAATPVQASWIQNGPYRSPFPRHRLLPYTSSSRLRPGSKFVGYQTSDRQKYEVEVEIKYVDVRESFLCGYLRIKGLTEDHPSLTTYFEGEIIGNKYSFITQHPEWGSNEKVDRQHWARFAAYKPLSKLSSRPDMLPKDWLQNEHMFMRWKEYFLVPDHRVRTINGASFEGFYYICFNQVSGGIEGIYFHAKSEKFQRLRLDHIEDYGCQGAIEFC